MTPGTGRAGDTGRPRRPRGANSARTRVERGPRAVRESLDDVLAGFAPPGRGTAGGRHETSGRASAATLGTVFGRWDETVGESIARHTRPLRLEGRTLVVAVDQPAWATQLRALAPGILERLGAATGEMIDHLEVVVRP